MSIAMPLRPATLVPLLLCLGLGALVAWEALDGGQPPAAAASVAGGGGTPAAAAPRWRISAMPPLAVYKDFLARPPFSESRRPPETATLAAGERPPFRLAGIVIADTGRLGLFAPDGGAALKRVAEGQVLDGWRVERVMTDRVILRDADRRVALTFGAADKGQAAKTEAGKGQDAPTATVAATGPQADQTSLTVPPTLPPPPGVKRPFPYGLSPKDTRWSAH